jgi:HD-like signal output (HDOD) protein
MTSEISKRIKSLPPLPGTIDRIQQLCLDPEEGMGELVKVISADPMLTANLLKVVNSPFYGFQKRVTSISHVVNLFGKNMIRGFVVAATLRRYLTADLSPYGITSQDLVEISELQRALAYRWITTVSPEHLNVISPASFMMEAGKLLIAQHVLATGEGDRFRRDLLKADDIGAVECRYAGQDGFGIAADLFVHWNFEDDLVDSIRHLEAPKQAPRQVRTCAWALKALAICVSVKGRFLATQIDRACEIAATAGLGPKTLAEASEQVAKSMSEAAA